MNRTARHALVACLPALLLTQLATDVAFAQLEITARRVYEADEKLRAH
jgi:hypothetical protein